MAEVKKIEPLQPLNRSEFGHADHRYNRFDATVDPSLTKADIEDPALWVNLAFKCRPGDEIRVRASDDSYVALLHVTYAMGSQLRLKTVYHAKLEKVDYDAMHNQEGEFEIKQRGPKKWCIMRVGEAEPIKEMIPTQLEAMKWLDEHKRSLAA